MDVVRRIASYSSVMAITLSVGALSLLGRTPAGGDP